MELGASYSDCNERSLAENNAGCSEQKLSLRGFAFGKQGKGRLQRTQQARKGVSG